MDFIVWLNVIMVVLVVIIAGLGILLTWYMLKGKKSAEEADKKIPKSELDSFNGITKEAIHKFMEFDEIKDDMIVRKNGEQFVMVIQCKGVNYDLMSEEEKMSIEGGFVQFLNAIRFPVQLYVQTRSLNLKTTVDEYKKRVEGIAVEIKELENRRKEAELAGNQDLASKMAFEVKRKQNVLEYGADISEYIARMSLNKNVLQQKTYVVISYYTAELGSITNYSKDEIRNICFSELYTRCQSVMRSLSSAQVIGKLLSSEELAELLYIAYNRDDSEIYQLSKALDAEYDALYSTAKDVLKKRQEKINQEIEEKAIDLASDAILEADNRRKQEKSKQEKIKEKAIKIVDEYKNEMETDLYEETKELIQGATLLGEETVEEEKPKKRQSRAKKA